MSTHAGNARFRPSNATRYKASSMLWSGRRTPSTPRAYALACHLSFVSSALCMTYIYVHLFFALAGLVFSLYLGSAWYDRMLTSHVTKKVRKHIAASTKKD